MRSPAFLRFPAPGRWMPYLRQARHPSRLPGAGIHSSYKIFGNQSFPPFIPQRLSLRSASPAGIPFSRNRLLSSPSEARIFFTRSIISVVNSADKRKKERALVRAPSSEYPVSILGFPSTNLKDAFVHIECCSDRTRIAVHPHIPHAAQHTALIELLCRLPEVVRMNLPVHAFVPEAFPFHQDFISNHVSSSSSANKAGYFFIKGGVNFAKKKEEAEASLDMHHHPVSISYISSNINEPLGRTHS